MLHTLELLKEDKVAQNEWLDGRRKAETVMMKTTEFAGLADHPTQRDTAKHARKASYLTRILPEHLTVQVGRLPDGRLFKINGHTRAYRYMHAEDFKDQEVPSHLTVEIYDCQDKKALLGAYDTYDSKQAVHTAADLVYGALRDVGLTNPQTDFIAKGNISTALALANEFLTGYWESRRTSKYDLVHAWIPEIMTLDTIGCSWQRFPAGIVAASLLALAVEPDKGHEFLEKWERNDGYQEEGYRDAIAEMDNRLLVFRATRNLHGFKNQRTLVMIFLSAFEAWMRDHMFKVSATGSAIKPLRGKSYERWAKRVQKAKAKQR